MDDSITGDCNYEGSKRGIQFDPVTRFRAFFSHGWGSQRFQEFFDKIVRSEAIGARERERKEFLVFRITNARPIGRAKLLLDRENVGRTDVREVVILSYTAVVRPGRQLTRIWSRHQLNSPLRTYRELKRSFKGGRRHGKVKAVLVLSRSDEFHATALPSVDINVFITRLRLTILRICYFLFARIVVSFFFVYPRYAIRTYERDRHVRDDLPRYLRYRFRVCSSFLCMFRQRSRTRLTIVSGEL